MSRVAAFVDAGYLFAQGSTALTGSKKPRLDLKLNEAAVITELTTLAQAKSEGRPLLRIYWYDGALGSRGLTLEHSTLAHMDHIKLRLGFVTSHGQQKGVDSLIVTDLIDLARNHAISDAVLLSGDEDVRIGVTIAQSFGVRVHLVGITPCRGSQSLQLMQEADTTSEWDNPTVAKFLSVKPAIITTPPPPIIGPPAPHASTGVPSAKKSTAVAAAPAGDPVLDGEAQLLAATLDGNEIALLKAYWVNSRTVPAEFDGKLLARSRQQLGRDLDAAEKRYVRAKFIAVVKGP